MENISAVTVYEVSKSKFVSKKSHANLNVLYGPLLQLFTDVFTIKFEYSQTECI